MQVDEFLREGNVSLFSQRKGLKSLKRIVQTDFIDDELRNGLWNTLFVCYWDRAKSKYLQYERETQLYCTLLWHNYFKRPLDELVDSWPKVRHDIRIYFFSCDWNEVYDFLEFTAEFYPNDEANVQFKELCNSVLEREVSAYRFVGDEISQITSEEEIAEVEEALESSSSLKPAANHLKRSLALLTDRNLPDYRNSIKESVSAVEAVCNLIAGSSTATLGSALKELDKKKSVDMHPALKGTFDKLYGYTSDADGIRHALLQEFNLDFEDAKFMLVSCSAFTNYLKAKSAKAGVLL